MRGAWGKPNGTVARVNIGQILLSVRTRDNRTFSGFSLPSVFPYRGLYSAQLIILSEYGFANAI